MYPPISMEDTGGCSEYVMVVDADLGTRAKRTFGGENLFPLTMRYQCGALRGWVAFIFTLSKYCLVITFVVTPFGAISLKYSSFVW